MLSPLLQVQWLQDAFSEQSGIHVCCLSSVVLTRIKSICITRYGNVTTKPANIRLTEYMAFLMC